MARLMQKERLKSPQKSLIIENQAFWVIWAIWAKTAIWVILASHFRTRVDTPKKSSTQGHACINETELHPDLAEIRPTGSQEAFPLPGLYDATAPNRQAKLGLASGCSQEAPFGFVRVRSHGK